MIDYSSISDRDLANYWRNTIVFSKSDGTAYKVSEISSPGGVLLLPYTKGNSPQTLPISKFFKDFVSHRVHLGWVNTDFCALYLSTYAGRDMRKGLPQDALRMYVPIYHDLHNSGTTQYVGISGGQSDELHHTLYSRIHMSLRHTGLDLLPLRPISLNEAVQAIAAGQRISAAITPVWALSVSMEVVGRILVYFEDTVVGYIEPDGSHHINQEYEREWRKIA